jgi:soluble lytic murein transglycosylase
MNKIFKAKLMIFMIWIFLFAETSIGSSQISKIPLSWKPNYVAEHWLFTIKQQYKGPMKLAELAEIKKLEFNRSYPACAEKTLKVFSKHVDLSHWLVMQGLACMNRALEEDSNWDSILIRDWFKKIKSSSDIFADVLLRDELILQWETFLVSVLKRNKVNQKLRWEIADYIYPFRESLSTTLKSDYFKSLSDLMNQAGFKDIAKIYSLRGDKAALALAIGSGNAPVNNGSPIAKNNNSVKTIETSKEESLYTSFTDLMGKALWLQASEKGIEFLDLFPGSGRAQAVTDKLINTYNNYFDRNNSADKTTLDHWRATLSKAHPSRLEMWARGCHRRADFECAIVLAKRALVYEEKSVIGAPLLFILGRSYFFLGQYDEALENFNKVLERHSGYAENTEVKFRKALIFLRTSKWEEADKLLQELTNERKSYGLSALYWLIRLREKNGQKTDDLMGIMQDKYYLTYYGLLLAAENKKQKISLDWPAAEPIKEQFFVTDNEFSAWVRAQKLIQAGWYLEASEELNGVFTPLIPAQKALLFQTYANMFSFPSIISWATDLFDSAPIWRNKELLSLVYPFPFRDWIELESRKNGLSPFLIVSLMRQESAFSLRAMSSAQAQGLMQLIPATVQEVAQDLKVKYSGMSEMYHPPTNIKFGTYYLSKVIKQFGNNVSIGLAAYNAGPQRLKKFFEARSEVLKQEQLSQQDPWSDLWIEELPWLETNLYVKSILRNAIIYQLIEKKEMELARPVWSGLIIGK